MVDTKTRLYTEGITLIESCKFSRRDNDHSGSHSHGIPADGKVKRTAVKLVEKMATTIVLLPERIVLNPDAKLLERYLNKTAIHLCKLYIMLIFNVDISPSGMVISGTSMYPAYVDV